MKIESRNIVVQNLKDHRTQLLNRVHTEEKKIYCLDYLIYQLKK